MFENNLKTENKVQELFFQCYLIEVPSHIVKKRHTFKSIFSRVPKINK